MTTRRTLGLLGLLLSACAGPQRAPPSEPPSPSAQQVPAAVDPKARPVNEPPPPATARVARKPAKAPIKAPPHAGPADEAPKTQSAVRPDPMVPAAAPLDLKSLEAGLKETNAIGFFTKIEIKNQVGDLVDEFRAVYQGRSQTSLSDLRSAYDRLLLKVLALLQDGDPRLAKAIAASRDSLWKMLSDPKTFATI